MNIYIILSLLLITNVLSSSDYLDKYEIFQHIDRQNIIFNSKDFKEDEEIYFRITGFFINEYIDFKFFDDYENPPNPNSVRFERESPTKVEARYYPNGAYQCDVRYYTIEKKKKYLEGIKGDYISIITYMNGFYDIENTKENFGYSKLVITIISVGIVVILIIIVIVYCIKRRKMYNQGYPSSAYNAQQKVPIQNNNGYNPNIGYPNI